MCALIVAGGQPDINIASPGEWAICQDNGAGLRQLEEGMEQRRELQAAQENEDWKRLRRGWCWGGEGFREELLERIGERKGQQHSSRHTLCELQNSVLEAGDPNSGSKSFSLSSEFWSSQRTADKALRNFQSFAAALSCPDLDRLCWRLQADTLIDVRQHLEAALGEQIGQEQLESESCWTEGLAVGSAGFLERIRPMIQSRQETDLVQGDRELWILREQRLPYGRKMASKNAPKGLN